MIEVRKLIPQVYNQSRDFSVFMGLIQTLINELDIKSYSLKKLPIESLLPTRLQTYSKVRSSFRFLLKEKGSIEGILQAIYLAGGKTVKKLEDENNTISGWDYSTANRDLSKLNEGREEEELINPKNDLVYYTVKREFGNRGLEITELYVNIKDQSKIDSGLLEELFYYIKPVNLIVRLNRVKLDN